MRLLILPLLLVLTGAWLNHEVLLHHQDIARADAEALNRERMAALYDAQEAAAAAGESCVAAAVPLGAN